MISRYWPKDRTGGVTTFFCRSENVIDFNVFMIPYPVLLFVACCELEVADDAMSVGITPCCDACVGRICDGRIDSPYMVDLATIFHHGSEVVKLHQFINVFPNHSINRKHQKPFFHLSFPSI